MKRIEMVRENRSVPAQSVDICTFDRRRRDLYMGLMLERMPKDHREAIDISETQAPDLARKAAERRHM